MTKVQITNEYGVQLGYVSFEPFLRLPAFIMIDGALYQRYGQVSAYRYVLEPNVFTPSAEQVSID